MNKKNAIAVVKEVTEQHRLAARKVPYNPDQVSAIDTILHSMEGELIQRFESNECVVASRKSCLHP